MARQIIGGKKQKTEQELLAELLDKPSDLGSGYLEPTQPQTLEDKYATEKARSDLGSGYLEPTPIANTPKPNTPVNNTPSVPGNNTPTSQTPSNDVSQPTGEKVSGEGSYENPMIPEKPVQPSKLDDVTNALFDKLINGSYKDPDDIYSQFMDIFNKEVDAPRIITDAEATAKAKDRYNTVYNDAFDKSMRNIDKNALRSGFYGQLPTAKLKSEAAANIESQRAGSITDLANQLISDSRSANFSERSLGMQEKGLQSNLLSSAIQNWSALSAQELDRLKTAYDVLSNEDQKVWDRELQEAGITGTWKGQDTLQKQSIDFDKALAEAGLTGMWKGAPTWAREVAQKNLDIAVANAAKKSSSGSGDSLTDAEIGEIRREIVETAHDMAIDQIKNIYGDKAPSIRSLTEGTASKDMTEEFQSWYNYFLEQLGAEGQVDTNDVSDGYVENIDISKSEGPYKSLVDELLDPNAYLNRYQTN